MCSKNSRLDVLALVIILVEISFSLSEIVYVSIEKCFASTVSMILGTLL